MIKVLAHERDAWTIQSNLDVIKVNKGDSVMCITYLGSVLTGSLYRIDNCYVRLMLDDNSFDDIRIGYINELKLTGRESMTNFEDLGNGFLIEWEYSNLVDSFKRLSATLCFHRNTEDGIEIIPVIGVSNINIVNDSEYPDERIRRGMRNKIIEQLEEIIGDIRSINEQGL